MAELVVLESPVGKGGGRDLEDEGDRPKREGEAILGGWAQQPVHPKS